MKDHKLEEVWESPYNGTLANLKHTIERYISKYGEDALVMPDYDTSGCYIKYWRPLTEKEKTAAEKKKERALQRKAEKKAQEEIKERALLEQLKQKYEVP